MQCCYLRNLNSLCNFLIDKNLIFSISVTDYSCIVSTCITGRTKFMSFNPIKISNTVFYSNVNLCKFSWLPSSNGSFIKIHYWPSMNLFNVKLLQTFIIYTSEISHSTFLRHNLHTATEMKSMINSCFVLYDKNIQKQPTISWEVYVSGLKLYKLLYFKTMFRSSRPKEFPKT